MRAQFLEKCKFSTKILKKAFGFRGRRLCNSHNAPRPTETNTGQESGELHVWHFQILVIFAVKIRKQCPETASAYGALRP